MNALSPKPTDDDMLEHPISLSLAITPDHAEIYVHWAEDQHEQGIIWYAAKVGGPDLPKSSSFDLEDVDDLTELRKQLHNILRWGIETRLDRVKSELAKSAESQNFTPTGAKRKEVP